MLDPDIVWKPTICQSWNGRKSSLLHVLFQHVAKSEQQETLCVTGWPRVANFSHKAVFTGRCGYCNTPEITYDNNDFTEFIEATNVNLVDGIRKHRHMPCNAYSPNCNSQNHPLFSPSANKCAFSVAQLTQLSETGSSTVLLLNTNFNIQSTLNCYKNIEFLNICRLMGLI